MANSSFQIATTPKLYVSYPLFQYASGALDSYGTLSSMNDRDMVKILNIDPSFQVNLGENEILDYKLVPSYDNYTPMVQSGLGDFDFCMFLGHNFNSTNSRITEIRAYSDEGQNDLLTSNIVNDCTSVPDYDGWSLMTMEGVGSDNARNIRFEFENSSEAMLGSLLFGKTYTFPRNVQLNTSTNFEYGISQKSTISGKTLSTANWTKPNNWITEPFGLSSDGEYGDNYQRRSGRRIWKMSFDSLAPDKVMPQNMMMNSNEYTAQDNHSVAADGTSSLYNINNSEDFYSMVIHRTMSSHLPVVLQIDSNDNSPSNFAICRLSSNYTVTQKSPLLFSYSITLTEQI